MLLHVTVGVVVCLAVGVVVCLVVGAAIVDVSGTEVFHAVRRCWLWPTSTS